MPGFGQGPQQMAFATASKGWPGRAGSVGVGGVDAGTLGGGLDVVEAQKMEPIPAHEVICNSSLVHDWRVAQLTRLGNPQSAGRSCCRGRRLASGRRVGAPRLPAPACLAHRPMKKTVVLYPRCARRVFDMPSSPTALERRWCNRPVATPRERAKRPQRGPGGAGEPGIR